MNPYLRPSGPTRPGEIPHGAALLTTVRQSPGGGRDLYAASDGQVYRRKPDGWYRRQANGWSYVAPLQGMANQNRVAPASKPVPRPVPATYRQNTRAQAIPNRVPENRANVRQADVSALEREHAARALAQQRQQNVQPNRNVNRPANVNRPVRSGGGGRRR
jgi:hypothetical protein